MARWLTQRADRIRARVDRLAAAATGRPPTWLAQLGPRPHHTDDGARWDLAVRDVVVYRDRYQVSDPDDALGSRPRHAGPQQCDWDALRLEQRRLRRIVPQHAGRRVVTGEARVPRPSLRL